MDFFRRLFRTQRPVSGGSLNALSDLQNRSSGDRMDALEQLLVYMLGQRRPEFGEPSASIANLSLPEPLARFYAFAGRWPSPHPDRSPIIYETPDEAYFYAGIQHSGMFPASLIKPLSEDLIHVFTEQSGNWIACTQKTGEDPCVWVQEALGLNKYAAPVQSKGTLSGWIVAVSLAAVAWESANSLLSCTVERRMGKEPDGLLEWFDAQKASAVRLWVGDFDPCREFSGSFYLIQSNVLAHEMDDLVRIAAITPEAADVIRKAAGRYE